MKARVIATGEIVTIMKNIGYPGGYVASNGRTYHDEDLTLIVNEDPDYWTRLEHKAAIAAMQALLSSDTMVGILSRRDNGTMEEEVAREAFDYAHALVEKYKKEERK